MPNINLSARAGFLLRADAERIRVLIERAGLPTRAPQIAPKRWLDLMAVDKKAAGGRMRFVLLHGMGDARLEKAADPRLLDETIGAATQKSL